MRNFLISYRLRHLLLVVTFMMTALPGETAWAMSFEYDTLGRVTKVTYDNGSYVVYAYDAAGNRTTVTGTRL